MRSENHEQWIVSGPAPAPAIRLALQDDSDTYNILDALEGVLSTDSSAEVVEVWVGRALVGHTRRSVLEREFGSDVFVTRWRAIGDGDPASLAGNPKLQPVQVQCRCCHERYWVPSFDERNPPLCPQGGEAMVPVA